jgi:hypothetical protein
MPREERRRGEQGEHPDGVDEPRGPSPAHREAQQDAHGVVIGGHRADDDQQ